MAPVKSQKSNRSDAGNYTCDKCGEEVRNRARGKHKCEKMAATRLGDILKDMAQDRVFLNQKSPDFSVLADDIRVRNTTNAGQSSGTILEGLRTLAENVSPVTVGSESAMREDFEYNINADYSTGDEVDLDQGNNMGAQLHDIKISYHPASKRPEQHFGINENLPGVSASAGSQPSDQVAGEAPWHPFHSRLDFEIAELSLNAHLSKADTEHLLSIIRRCIETPEQFTLSSHKDLSEYWNMARSMTDCFTKKTMTIPYQNTTFEFNVWTRSLEAWCRELLGDEDILPHFQWDAQRKYQFNGVTFERIIDEPWTANAWWDIQTKIPDGGKPLCLLIYADKSRLSSFGTAKAYPVLARCANLPVEIRNGEDVDGGRLVGWLPIIKEDAAESGKKDYVNMKRVVWHEAFFEILKTLEQYAKTGWYFTGCADEIPRWLFPVVLLLSADYEEQCVMALIRGINSHFPCPVCLVPGEKLSDLSVTFPLRTTEAMKAIYEEANNVSSAAEKEAILKEFGLRDVKNAFWSLENTDVYSAISWDRLHAYHGGLFSDHLWVLFKELLEELGRESAARFDTQIDNIPRWSGLNHFSSLLKNSEFADSSKYEDMGKIVIYGAYNILTEENSEEGYLVLRIIRSYLELDMFASLTVHTEVTLAAGREELQRYSDLIKEHQQHFPESKSWNFPKAHTHKHLFDDIERKGVTRNYNSKPNEKAHRPFKKFYLLDTNFKDTDPQILKLSEKTLITLMIQQKIEIFDEKVQAHSVDPNLNDDLSYHVVSHPSRTQNSYRSESIIGSEHVSLGSPSTLVSIGEIERQHADNPSFTNFRKKIGNAFSNYFNENIRFNAVDQIIPYKHLKVSYSGVINPREIRTDILRAHPQFHGRPRYDYVLIKANDTQCMLAQLLEVFGITFRGKEYYMALILPFDRPIPLLNRRRDKDLRLTRVRSRKRLESAVVDTETIIRGALLTQEYDYPDEYFVLDAVDDDFWWRMKSVSLAQNINM